MFDLLEPWTSRAHTFHLRLTNADEPGVPQTPSAQVVDFLFGLNVIFGPGWDAVDQVDPDADGGLLGDIRGHPDLIVAPDFQRHYLGTVIVPAGISAGYCFAYEIE